MTAKKKIYLGELAEDVLRTVEAADLEKNSEMTYTKKAAATTQVGVLIEKVAEQLRLVNPTEISYDDLQNFRKRYGV